MTDKEKAGELCLALLATADKFKDRVNDPEGRVLSLGTCMFVGMVLATLKHDEDRQKFCDAAMGYSLKTDQILSGLTGGFTIVLHTDGLYYVADQALDDYVSQVGHKTLAAAQAELHEYERKEEEDV